MSQTPSIPGQTSLIPVNDCLLVCLDKPGIKEGKYASRTSGIVVTAPSGLRTWDGTKNILDTIVGKRVYWEEFKEGGRIKRDGEQYSFIKYEDLRGYEDVKTN